MEEPSRVGTWNPSGGKEWLTVRDVVGMLRIHPDTVRRWIRTKKLAATFLGGSTGYRIRGADLRTLLLRSTARQLETAEAQDSSRSHPPTGVQG